MSGTFNNRAVCKPIILRGGDESCLYRIDGDRLRQNNRPDPPSASGYVSHYTTHQNRWSPVGGQIRSLR
jgi:hypothetical protein